MLYDRKIKYLDYLENGQRIQGVGYVKLERREETLGLELAVTGLRATDSCERDVMICGAGEAKCVGKIIISNGRGQWKQLFRNLENMGGTGISYEELQGVRIPVGVGREISSGWRHEAGKALEGRDAAKSCEGEMGMSEGSGRGSQAALAEHAAPEKGMERKGWMEPEEGAGRKDRAMPERGMERKSRMEPEEGAGRKDRAAPGEGMERKGRKEPEEGAGRKDRAAPERGMERKSRMEPEEGAGRKDRVMRRGNREIWAAESAPVQNQEAGDTEKICREASAEKQKRGSEKPVRLLEDKWQQLWAIYPHIKPFEDKREYLSIGPSDFVLFSSASYKMVNNSFLLHGYYNYRHLILARLEKKGEPVYYIGVPGSYFEKEKQVAIMFGFESFECAEEPAQPGDFGYYMMRTQL